MSQGGTRPYGHQGLVDGGGEVPGGFKGLCDDDPLPVGGAASPGVSQYASRCDHVHPSGELPLFNLALSYGQGPTGNDALNPGEAFWFQSQGENRNLTPVTYESPELDLTATSSDTVIVPARPGFFFVPVPSSNCFRLRVTAKAGTLSTSPTINIGNNGAETNYFPSGTPNLSTPFTAGVGSTFTLGGGPNIVMADMSAPIRIDVTAAATGTGLTFGARVSITGYYIPIAAAVGPQQVREWPIARALAYVGLIVWVDAAEIILAEGGDDPRFIVTVDGVDTILQLVLTEGTHAGGELLSTGAFIDVAANSRIGVRFDGTGLDAGCSLRCEMMIDGAGSGSPVPPPPIPPSGLLADWASENYVLAIESGPNLRGTWTDDSGNENDLFTGLGSDPTAFPQTEANAFNDDPGVTFVRGVTSSPPTTSFNPYVWYAPNTPRTIAMVVRGDNLSVGNLLDVSGSHVYTLQGGTLPQPAYIQCSDPPPSIPINTTDFVDINGQKAVLMWWSEGGIGDTLHFAVNGVEIPLDAPLGTEPAHINLGIGRGTFIDLALTLMADASFARVLAWNRVLTPAERIGVLSNLTARYL